MITKETLSTYNTYKDPYQVEKDYLQDLVLYGIYANSSNEMVLKGGTAFSKFYHSDRFSDDLDFTIATKTENAKEFSISLIKKSTELLEYRHSYKEEPHMDDFSKVVSTILVEGPRFNGKGSTLQQLSIEISTTSALYLGQNSIPRNPVYEDARAYVASVMKPEEILAEKVRALMSKKRRHRERDLYDLYFFIGKRTEIKSDVIKAKLSEAEIMPSKDEFVASVAEISRNWKDLEPMVQHKLEDFRYVSEFVIKSIGNCSAFE